MGGRIIGLNQVAGRSTGIGIQNKIEKMEGTTRLFIHQKGDGYCEEKIITEDTSLRWRETMDMINLPSQDDE